jgi:hypothetical protein
MIRQILAARSQIEDAVDLGNVFTVFKPNRRAREMRSTIRTGGIACPPAVRMRGGALGIAIADVAGKGVAASLIMASVKAVRVISRTSVMQACRRLRRGSTERRTSSDSVRAEGSFGCTNPSRAEGGGKPPQSKAASPLIQIQRFREPTIISATPPAISTPLIAG